ncbi:metal-dependent protein hydrolase [Aspergillus cavernicola]|uniref:Metal-dependent protein hydrolase n=1 Tax=Aspergillus cavernicola TaxID=176166 RepID=A0ABR4IGR5_9EURO
MLRRIFKMAEESLTKKARTSPLIGTHNGHFHADEALAVYLLRLLPTYSQSPLIRTRDPALLATCHTVVDVGGEYEPTNNRYDHHQRTFSTTFPGYNTKLSSAGLVYMHFGHAIVARHLSLPAEHGNVGLIYNKLYADFVEAVDANDNGVAVYDPEGIKSAGVEKRFKDGGVTIASIVNDMNNPYTEEEEKLDEDGLFLQASQFIGSVFSRKLKHACSSWLPARETVKEAYESRKSVHDSGKIMVLPQGGVPWKEHLYNFEKQAAAAGEESEVYFVLYPESATEGSKWRVQTVSVNEGSFISRKPLPENWRGVRDADLDGVLAAEAGEPRIPEGAVFVHAAGFIGGHKTREGAHAMAVRGL